ncbi:hypothetical protein OF83DRAFT_891671 [Amylostereum chailletii]|nr:hypothetical protein OF83DRAFT_891671 [Amylostereum chailletii]
MISAISAFCLTSSYLILSVLRTRPLPSRPLAMLSFTTTNPSVRIHIYIQTFTHVYLSGPLPPRCCCFNVASLPSCVCSIFSPHSISLCIATYNATYPPLRTSFDRLLELRLFDRSDQRRSGSEY